MQKQPKPKTIEPSDKLLDALKKSTTNNTFSNDDNYLRLYRAISWLKAAEKNKEQLDIAYAGLWIAFNACYAIDDLYELNKEKLSERNSINIFLKKITELDAEKRIYNLLWNRYSAEVKMIIENEFIFMPFWEYHRAKLADYKSLLQTSIINSNKYLAEQNVPGLLEIILKRLYVLRNQIFHGGSTYNSKVNRQQLKDGIGILQRLVPIIIEIMMQHPAENWGKAAYPVINPPKK